MDLPVGKNASSAAGAILEAAAETFAQLGYAATSVRAIATRAGVAKPMLYYYFGSKEGLWRAVVSHALVTYRAELAPAGLGGDLRERLLAVARAHARFTTTYAHASLLDRPLGAPRNDEGLLSTLRQVLAALLPDPARAELVAVLINAGAGGGDPTLADKKAEQVVELLWHGLAAQT